MMRSGSRIYAAIVQLIDISLSVYLMIIAVKSISTTSENI